MAIPKSKDARAFYRCADRRRDEAAILYRADKPTGAVYLAGYVAEFMLKALVLESTPAKGQDDMLQVLKRIGHNLTGLRELYTSRGGTGQSTEVVRALALVSDWSPQIRYDPRELDPSEADRFLKAVDTIYTWADGRIG